MTDTDYTERQREWLINKILWERDHYDGENKHVTDPHPNGELRYTEHGTLLAHNPRGLPTDEITALANCLVEDVLGGKEARRGGIHRNKPKRQKQGNRSGPGLTSLRRARKEQGERREAELGQGEAGGGAYGYDCD